MLWFLGRRSKAKHLVSKDAAEDLCSGQLQHGSGQRHQSQYYIRTMSFTLLSPPGSRVMSRQDDGVDDPKARGALRASTTETLQADHQAGSPPHNQGGRLKHFFLLLINFSRCATRFQRRSAC